MAESLRVSILATPYGPAVTPGDTWWRAASGRERGDEIRSLVAAEPDGDGGWLEQLCAAVARAVPAAGAAVSLIAGHAGAVAAATGPLGAALADLQFTLGEGPAIDAFTERRPALEPDLRTTWRWPIYAPAAQSLGVAAIFAAPLQIGAVRLGSLDVYRTQAGSLTPHALMFVLMFAEAATEALLDDPDKPGSTGVVAMLAHMVDRDAVVYQAQGMIMAQLDIPLRDALVRLRAHAYASDRSLRQVAADVISGQLHLEPD